MSKSSIDTLIPDIYERLQNPRPLDGRLIEEFSKNLSDLMYRRLTEERTEKYLRMSNLGQGDRKLWYSLKTDHPGEEFSGSALLKFILGDIFEAVILLLAEASGHEVTHKQEQIEVDGVKGHTDAIIDGVVVDAKSASPYAFKKFKEGRLADDDPFGYMEQLAGYVEGHDGTRDGAFLAGEKVLGTLALLKVPNADLKALNVRGRIEHIKEVLDSDTIPDRCHSPEPEGVSGNEVLNTNCSYCPFKFECWKDSNNGLGLRTFLYSKGPTHFTKVVKEPKVMEITF